MVVAAENLFSNVRCSSTCWDSHKDIIGFEAGFAFVVAADDLNNSESMTTKMSKTQNRRNLIFFSAPRVKSMVLPVCFAPTSFSSFDQFAIESIGFPNRYLEPKIERK